MRELVDALANASHVTGEPLAFAAPTADADAEAVAAALLRMLCVDDPRASRREAWAPRPDLPPHSVPTGAAEALIRMLPHDPERRGQRLQALLDAIRDHQAVGVALAYRLTELAERDPSWAQNHLDDLLGPLPDGPPDAWGSAFAAHMAGAPLPATIVGAALPWYRAAAGHLGPADADDPDSRGSTVVDKLVRATLAGAIGSDDTALAVVLGRGGGLPAAILGQTVMALREAASLDGPTAVRARELADTAVAAADEVSGAAADAAGAMAGMLADPDVVGAVGADWVLHRLRGGLSHGVAPYGAWHVARLLTAEAVTGRPDAGDMCAALARVLGPRDLDAVGDLLATAVAKAGGDELWAAEVTGVLAVHLGPDRVAGAAARPLPPPDPAPRGGATPPDE